MEGWDALGTKLTPLQIKNGFRLHKIAEEKPEDYDLLAQELNLNIDEDALDLIEEQSPTRSRQILRKTSNPTESEQASMRLGGK